MKRVLLVLAGLVLLGVIGVVVAFMRLDAQSIRNQVAEAVRSATGKPLIMQDIPKVSFMPLGVTFGAAYWGVTPDGKLDPAGGISAAVKSGQVVVQLLPLLSGKVLVDEVRLDSPNVTIRPETKPAAQTTPPKAADSKASAEPPIPPQVEVNRLRLTNASIFLEMGSGQTVRLSKLNLELDNLKVGEEMRLDLSTQLAMSDPDLEGALALKAKAYLQTQNYELRDISLRFTPVKGVVPAAIGPIDLALRAKYEISSGKLNLAMLSLTAQGAKVELDGEADVRTLAFNGKLKVDSPPRKLAQGMGISLPFKKGLESFKLQNTVAMTGQTLSLGSIQGMLDTTSIDGKLSLELGKMHVAGTLNLGALNLDALMASAPLLPVLSTEALVALISPAEALAATSQRAPSKSQPAAPRTPPAEPGPATPKSPNTPPAAANNALPSVDMELACASLTVSKLQFKDIRAKARGQGLYRIEPLSLNLGTGGTVQMQLGIDANAMRYTAAGKVSNVAVGPLLQALQGKRPVDGTANLDLDNIACAGTTPKAVQASLSGKGLLTVRGIVLNDVSILPKDAPAGLGNPPTHFEQLTVPFTASGGIVNLAPVTLTSPAANVKGQGVVRLPQESLEFTADISLLKIATIPVQASGPFNSLSYGLDGKRALQMLTQTPAALGEAAGKKAEEAARGAKNLFKGITRP
ncbi:MAG: AsmA family protein [Deltaproteobacteria bacterium]|jgi:AsmA protein|nr:AsmA family protein [Deltaproteobacteria bacterium]